MMEAWKDVRGIILNSDREIFTLRDALEYLENPEARIIEKENEAQEKRNRLKEEFPDFDFIEVGDPIFSRETRYSEIAQIAKRLIFHEETDDLICSIEAGEAVYDRDIQLGLPITGPKIHLVKFVLSAYAEINRDPLIRENAEGMVIEIDQILTSEEPSN